MLNGIDISIILSLLLWMLFSFTHRHPLGVWSKRQKIWYLNTIETTKIGLKYENYLIYYIIIIPLFSLSLWYYIIKEAEHEVDFSIFFVFIILLNIFIEKIWNIFHWDKKIPFISNYLSIIISILYFLSLLILIINTKFKYKILNIILLIQSLWFLYHSYIDYKWIQFPCVWSSPKKKSIHSKEPSNNYKGFVLNYIK